MEYLRQSDAIFCIMMRKHFKVGFIVSWKYISPILVNSNF